MGFMQNVRNMLDNEYNLSVTENGALGYRSTGKALLDLNFAVSSLRNATAEEMVEKFVKAYYENPLQTVKWLFFAGDVRQGLGERRLFRTLFVYLAHQHIGLARALMPLVPEYSRWDIVAALLDTPLAEEAAGMVAKQLQEDRAGMEAGRSASLCAKWLPSENASSPHTRRLARILADRLAMTAREYRQTLSALRKYLDVVEVKMSAGQWDRINYEAVPSRANLVYGRAFLRNDGERRKQFLDALQKGEKEIHGGVLYPHDIVHSYFTYESRWQRRLKPADTTLEELWKALPDFVQGEGNTLCVADGSGSMISTVGNSKVTCLDVANALAIYFSQHCEGQFRDCYITFSQNPQFVDLSKGENLHDKLEIALCYDECANTDIEAVFQLILDTAVKNRTPQKELPANLLVLSDMEFDMASSRYDGSRKISPDARLFDTIARRYADCGYRLPRLVFWNICSRTQTVPVQENALGVALVSGFSPTIMKMVLSNGTDPYQVLLEQLASPRYQAVEEAVQGVLSSGVS